MSRVAISEYAAKKLILGEAYTGITVTHETIDDAVSQLADSRKYIIKIDVGIKKRGKQGLIWLNVSRSDAKKAI